MSETKQDLQAQGREIRFFCCVLLVLTLSGCTAIDWSYMAAELVAFTVFPVIVFVAVWAFMAVGRAAGLTSKGVDDLFDDQRAQFDDPGEEASGEAVLTEIPIEPFDSSEARIGECVACEAVYRFPLDYPSDRAVCTKCDGPLLFGGEVRRKMSNSDASALLEKLNRLGEMRELGVITPKEFEDIKTRILDSL